MSNQGFNDIMEAALTQSARDLLITPSSTRQDFIILFNYFFNSSFPLLPPSLLSLPFLSLPSLLCFFPPSLPSLSPPSLLFLPCTSPPSHYLSLLSLPTSLLPTSPSVSLSYHDPLFSLSSEIRGVRLSVPNMRPRNIRLRHAPIRVS